MSWIIFFFVSLWASFSHLGGQSFCGLCHSWWILGHWVIACDRFGSLSLARNRLSHWALSDRLWQIWFVRTLGLTGWQVVCHKKTSFRLKSCPNNPILLVHEYGFLRPGYVLHPKKKKKIFLVGLIILFYFIWRYWVVVALHVLGVVFYELLVNKMHNSWKTCDIAKSPRTSMSTII